MTYKTKAIKSKMMNKNRREAIIRAKRDADLARLSEAGRRFYEQELCAGTESASRVAQALWHIDFERKPESVRQFVYDDLYLGKALKSNIFPKLVDDLEEFFEGDYTEALLAGGIAWGKSRWAEVAIAYDIYRVSCLRDPAVTFGMISGSTVAFVNISVTISQARKVIFEGLGSLLRQSPYFQEVFPLDKKLKSMLKFPKGVVAYPATASPEGVLGEGIFSAAVDEANFMQLVERSRRSVPGDTGPYDQAEATYNKLSSRIMSRMVKKGRVPGHIYIISSARYPEDFTERMEKNASTPDGRRIFVRREMIQRMFELGRQHGLKHPYLPVDADGRPLPVTLQQPDPDIEKLVPENLHWMKRPKTNELGSPIYQDSKPVMETVLYPALYHAHIDLSKNHDATGLVVTHVVGTKQCQRMVMEGANFKETIEEKPIIWVDLALQITAPLQGEVDIPKVRAVIYRLAQLGMQFGSVTFDQTQSQESIKTMKDKGFPSDHFSVDRTKEAYEALKDAIYDERVYCYENPVLQRELGQLEDTGNKIDHPAFPGASKDVADCLAAAVLHCEAGWRAGEGSRGLFQNGRVERPNEPTLDLKARLEAISAKVVDGQALTSDEEDTLLFSGLEEL